MLTHVLAILPSNLFILDAVEYKDVETQQRVEANEAVAIDGGGVLVRLGASQVEVGGAPNSAQKQEEHKGAANVEATGRL